MKRKKLLAYSIALSLGSILNGCYESNYQTFDTKQGFNVLLEPEKDFVGIIPIKEYNDYVGNGIQIKTQDGLVVYGSTLDSHLLDTPDTELLEVYLQNLGYEQEDMIIYNKLQEIPYKLSQKNDTKKNDHTYKYDYAIIKEEDRVGIFKITSWKDYEEDDKIQIVFEDGTTGLYYNNNIRLLSTTCVEKNKEDAVYNYALTLSGKEENIHYGKSFGLERVKE